MFILKTGLQMEEIKKKYEKLRETYTLPKFDEIDRIFEISTIENEEFLLRDILGKIIMKLEYYIKLLEELLQPDTSSMSSMHEINFFTESQKRDIYFLYKSLMKLHREAIETDLIQSEKNEAEYISKILKNWNSVKQELLGYIKTMKESWDKETKMEEELGYLG